MNMVTIKQLYAADDVAIIKKALEYYANMLEKKAEELTDIDERYERNDALLEAQAARILSKDFE